MFRIKEVLPVKKKVFWIDLKFTRRIYQGRARDDAGGVLTTREADDIHNANVERMADIAEEDVAQTIISNNIMMML